MSILVTRSRLLFTHWERSAEMDCLIIPQTDVLARNTIRSPFPCCLVVFFSQLSRIDVRSDLSFHYNPFFIILIYIIAITLPVLFRRTFSWGHQRKLVFLKHYFVVKISVVIPGVTWCSCKEGHFLPKTIHEVGKKDCARDSKSNTERWAEKWTG